MNYLEENVYQKHKGISTVSSLLVCIPSFCGHTGIPVLVANGGTFCSTEYSTLFKLPL